MPYTLHFSRISRYDSNGGKKRIMDTPLIFDTSDGQQLRINMIGSWLKRQFGSKVVKLSVDGGFTCPNRDGSKGYGGCLFCSDTGSGDMASSTGDLVADLEQQIRLLQDKWPHATYMAYFQSHTNTYAPVDVLRAKFEEALSHPKVSGLAIATRPDCLTEEAIDLLADLNERTFLWVELGLQTIHDQTAKAMNLCHDLADYDDALKRLHNKGLRVVTHLILGLPGETEGQMLESVRYVCRPLGDSKAASSHLFGLKLHMLNVVRNSALPAHYPGYDPFGTIDEYTDLVIRALEIIPPQITIHRISGDAPRPSLIAPSWSWQKRTILNQIHRKMREQNTWQGRLT